jgi:hypothetical protein
MAKGTAKDTLVFFNDTSDRVNPLGAIPVVCLWLPVIPESAAECTIVFLDDAGARVQSLSTIVVISLRVPVITEGAAKRTSVLFNYASVWINAFDAVAFILRRLPIVEEGPDVFFDNAGIWIDSTLAHRLLLEAAALTLQRWR